MAAAARTSTSTSKPRRSKHRLPRPRPPRRLPPAADQPSIEHSLNCFQKDFDMKNYLIGVAGALVLISGIGTSFAEDVIILKPEQQTVVREYIHKQKLASVSLLGVELNVGTAL